MVEICLRWPFKVPLRNNDDIVAFLPTENFCSLVNILIYRRVCECNILQSLKYSLCTHPQHSFPADPGPPTGLCSAVYCTLYAYIVVGTALYTSRGGGAVHALRSINDVQCTSTRNTCTPVHPDIVHLKAD